MDTDDGWILDEAVNDTLSIRVRGHLQNEDDNDETGDLQLLLNKTEHCGPAGLLKKLSFKDEELVPMTLSGNFAHRIIRLGVEHPHLFKDTRRETKERSEAISVLVVQQRVAYRQGTPSWKASLGRCRLCASQQSALASDQLDKPTCG